jgi:hypothetical protein
MIRGNLYTQTGKFFTIYITRTRKTTYIHIVELETSRKIE